MSDRVATAKIALAKMDAEIAKAEGSNGRIDALRQQRRSDYVGVFQAILEEEKTLQALSKAYPTEMCWVPNSHSETRRAHSLDSICAGR